MAKLEGKRILFIIAQRNFDDKELSSWKEMLEAEGASTEVAGIEFVESLGISGRRVSPKRLVREINPTNYDVLIIIGGLGVAGLANYPEVLDLVRRFRERHKPLIAVGFAPYVLARADIVKGVRISCLPADFLLSQLRRAGAVYEEEEFVEDDKIITMREFKPELAKRAIDKLR